MDYQALYQEKRTTPENAVKRVKSGDWVDYGWCTNHPVALDRALAARKDELHDVKVQGGVTMWMPEIAKAEDAGEHFTWHAWHMSGIDRQIAAKGMGYFIPMRYSELPRFYREEVEVDVDEGRYLRLMAMLSGPMIEKEQRRYPLPGGLTLEVNQVDPALESGFYYAEVEFDTEAAALAWTPPEALTAYLSHEVTGQPGESMAAYWASTRG